MGDLPCEATIRPAAKRLSGFCECAHQTLTRTELAVGCGRSAGSDLRRWLLPARPFTCEEACARKIRIKTGRAAVGESGRGAGALAGVSGEAAVPRPSGGTAAADRPDCPAESHPSFAAPPPPPPPAAEGAEEAASRSVREQLWADLDRAFIAAGGLNVQPAPGLPKCPNLSGPSLSSPSACVPLPTALLLQEREASAADRPRTLLPMVSAWPPPPLPPLPPSCALSWRRCHRLRQRARGPALTCDLTWCFSAVPPNRVVKRKLARFAFQAPTPVAAL